LRIGLSVSTVTVALSVAWPTGLARTIGARRTAPNRLALGNETDGLRARRGALTALVAAAGAMAAAVWQWRPPAADGDGHQTVARWVIPGGEGRCGVAMIFDDLQAARDVRHGSRNLGEERFRAVRRHQRAMYVKHAARGEESFVVYTDYPSVRETLRYPAGAAATDR
jgi:hypothetical protein